MSADFPYTLLLRHLNNGDDEKECLSRFFDAIPKHELHNTEKFFIKRLVNTKIYIKLTGKRILVFDDGLFWNVDGFLCHFDTVVFIDKNISKLRIAQKRNNIDLKKLICILHNKTSLPFKNSCFDAIWITDIGKDLAHIDQTIKEISRVIKKNGSIFVSLQTNIKHTKKYIRYIESSLSSAGLKTQQAVFFAPRHGMPVEAVDSRSYRFLSNPERDLHRRFRAFVQRNLFYPLNTSRKAWFASPSEKATNTLTSIQRKISTETQEELYIEKVLFLSSTIIFLRNKNRNGKSYIARVPYSKLSANRVAKNYHALKYIKCHREELMLLSPNPVLYTTVDGVQCYVEEMLHGYTFDTKTRYYNKLTSKCANISMEISVKTRIDISQHIDNYSKTLDTLFQLVSPKYIEVIQNEWTYLKSLLRETVLSGTLPGCLCHGDFKVENVLFDKSLTITGIIDWDLFLLYGFPFLDIFHLLARRRMLFYGGTPICLLKAMTTDGLDPFERKIIYQYADIFSLSKKCIYLSILIYWLHHVKFRIGLEEIKTHKLWFCQNIEKPIKSIYSKLR